MVVIPVLALRAQRRAAVRAADVAGGIDIVAS